MPGTLGQVRMLPTCFPAKDAYDYVAACSCQKLSSYVATVHSCVACFTVRAWCRWLAAPSRSQPACPDRALPVPIAIAVPEEVTEGCAGNNNGLVEFDHADSFHPEARGRLYLQKY